MFSVVLALCFLLRIVRRSRHFASKDNQLVVDLGDISIGFNSGLAAILNKLAEILCQTNIFFYSTLILLHHLEKLISRIQIFKFKPTTASTRVILQTLFHKSRIVQSNQYI